MASGSGNKSGKADSKPGFWKRLSLKGSSHGLHHTPSGTADIPRSASGPIGGGAIISDYSTSGHSGGSEKTPRPSFHEFDESSADAWGGDDIDDPLQSVEYHRRSSMSMDVGGKKLQRPASRSNSKSNGGSRSTSASPDHPGKARKAASAGQTDGRPRATTQPTSVQGAASSDGGGPADAGATSRTKSNDSNRRRRSGSAPMSPTEFGGASPKKGGSGADKGKGKGPRSERVSKSPDPIHHTVKRPPSVDLDSRAREAARLAKFTQLLTSPNLDLDALRKLSWPGVPPEVRPDTWRLLSGYLPANIDRRETTLERKRAEYRGFIEQYYNTAQKEEKLVHQIHIDVLRTNPNMADFHNDATHQLFERVLYIWAIRHPGSGYVQGINELVTPFVTVFLSPFLRAQRRKGVSTCARDAGSGAEGEGEADDHDTPSTATSDVDVDSVCDASRVDADTRDMVEADSYWCLTKLLDGIQDNYVAGQPGIQKRILSLKDLVSRVDKDLHTHLADNTIEYIQFSFRWFNCLLMRELPLRCTIRLWDTYHAEPEGFATFHLYVCAAFLTTFSKTLRGEPDFQGLIMALQKLPTEEWTGKEIEMLAAEAYRLKFMFHDARNHLQ
eukprot:m.830919 g.830919  ORF g.830919 m.830919 type:complete len:614 (-) comp23427_c0_seq5:1556-3397(-)